MGEGRGGVEVGGGHGGHTLMPHGDQWWGRVLRPTNKQTNKGTC